METLWLVRFRVCFLLDGDKGLDLLTRKFEGRLRSIGCRVLDTARLDQIIYIFVSGSAPYAFPFSVWPIVKVRVFPVVPEQHVEVALFMISIKAVSRG